MGRASLRRGDCRKQRPGKVFPVGENSRCKGPEVAQKLVHTKTRKAAMAATHEEGQSGTGEAGEVDAIQEMSRLTSKELDFTVRAAGTTEKFGAGTRRI